MKNHVSDMIATINNGQLSKKPFILQTRQKMCEKILNVLWDEGLILGYKNSKSNPKHIKIFLKYQNGVPSINTIKRLSKPSLRYYYSVKQVWKINSNQGIVLLSTSKGILSQTNCKKKNIGGEPVLIVK
jgi:small subunit ribosomal protein S8